MSRPIPTTVARRAGGMLRRASVGLVTLLASWLVPGLALACTVCMGGQEEESRKAFIGTTAFLTFFPLLMLGVVIGWFVRRALAHEREEEARLQAHAAGSHTVPSEVEPRGAVRPLF